MTTWPVAGEGVDDDTKEEEEEDEGEDEDEEATETGKGEEEKEGRGSALRNTRVGKRTISFCRAPGRSVSAFAHRYTQGRQRMTRTKSANGERHKESMKMMRMNM